MPLEVHWRYGITYGLSGTELPYRNVAAHVSYCLNKTLIYNVFSDSIIVWTIPPQIIFLGAISLICYHCEYFPFNFICVSIIRKIVVCVSFPFFTEMTHHFLKFRLWVKILLSGFEIANIKMQNQWKGQTYAEM